MKFRSLYSALVTAVGFLPMQQHEAHGQDLAHHPATLTEITWADQTGKPSVYDIAKLIVTHNKGLQPVAEKLDMNNPGSVHTFLTEHPQVKDVIIPAGEMMLLQNMINEADEEQKDWLIISSTNNINARYALSVSQAQEIQSNYNDQQEELKLSHAPPLYVSAADKNNTGACYELDLVTKRFVPTHTIINLEDIEELPIIGMEHLTAHENVHHLITENPDILPQSRSLGALPPAIEQVEEKISDTGADKIVKHKHAIFVGLGRDLCAPEVFDKPTDLAIQETVKALRQNMRALGKNSRHPSIYERLSDHVMRENVPFK